MDCPHCKTSNPLGATNCSHCFASLSSAAVTVVAEMTPPSGASGATITGETVLPTNADTPISQSAPASMAIPTSWSVPATGGGAGEPSSGPIRPGSIVGNRYEIIAVLGEGGMGAVYKARDRELDRFVALKIIRPELAGRPEILQRFKQELILARKVTHRNVIRIFDLGDADGLKFITMEFIEGEDLKAVIARDGKLPPDKAVSIIEQVCLALEAAHTEGVVHRDLKPQNIMLDQQGRACVMDFGIARSLEFGGMTQTGALIGTPEYMSPEQVRGEHVDARSDLFTLGIIFQEILTGKLPYEAETAMASMFKRTKERAVSVRQLDPAVPQYLSDIVAKCLEIAPEDRFQSARALYDALEEWRSGSAAPRRIRSWAWARRAVRNRTAFGFAAAGAALAVLLMVAVVAFRMYSSRKTAPHAPVSILVADFTNNTGDPIFDGTLEPMVNVALEGASFINAYSRGTARKLAEKLPHPTNKLDDQTARLVAVNQDVNAVVTGELGRRGNEYTISAAVLDPVTGNVLAKTEVTAANEDAVLLDIPKLTAPIRKALGDTTPESVQIDNERGALSAASLEVVHQYGIAIGQLFDGNFDQALRSASNVVALDPNFARGYVVMASAEGDMGRMQDAERDVKLAMEHVDRMTERERYRIRGQYYMYTGNWPKCVEEYGELGKRFPADNVAQGNLSSCYMALRKIPEGIAAMQRQVDLEPKVAVTHTYLSLYLSYGGDFGTAEREARTGLALNRSSPEAYLALAEAQLGRGQMSQAKETYQDLEKVNQTGASLAAFGLADLAAYEGRYVEAVRVLERGVAADLAAKDYASAGLGLAALARVQLWRGDEGAAAAAAAKAVATSQEMTVKVVAAQAFVEAGEFAKAKELASGLASEGRLDSQAYAKIVDGDLALKRGETNDAIKLFTDANNLLDTWPGHFELGRAYLEAGHFVEADSELDRCMKRRGEALEVFFDTVPTAAYLPFLYYYQGRIREGLKSPGFAEPYRTYLSIRGKAGEDPLLADIHRRLGK
jgi:tetratricopeptide (TPR) repeat protein/predicted Ser/Thr protein kinase